MEVDETSHVEAYGVGISNEILKLERVMSVEELGSSSWPLHAKYKPQILFLKFVALSFQKNGSLLQHLGSLHPAAALRAAMAAVCI